MGPYPHGGGSLGRGPVGGVFFFRHPHYGAAGCPTNRAAVVGQERALKLRSRSYRLTKAIVHGLLVLITWPAGVSIPFAWLILNGTIASVFC
jgi:hypothetical protein